MGLATASAAAGLIHLKGLAGLKKLGLGSTQISDAGLEHLKGLTKLRGIYLQETKVTYAGVAELQFGDAGQPETFWTRHLHCHGGIRKAT